MKRISDRIRTRGVLVSDGAWGTFLQKLGMKPGECPELWCVEHPEAVSKIAEAYAEAGAEILKTNSFGATRFKLERFGLADRVAELNEAAAAISRRAAGKDRLVAASMGPTGKLLLMEDVTGEEMYNAFRDQAVALERGGADACCIETMSGIDEAVTAIKAVRENTALEIICTGTFERSVRGDYRTMMGASPEEMAKACVEAGADIIGANCGNGMGRMAEIAAAIRRACPDRFILVHANAGIPVSVNGADVFPETPEIMAGHAVRTVKAGANIVGGCCGTTPEHIMAIARAVKELKPA